MNKGYNIDIGKLNELKQKLNLTYEDIGKEMGISRSAVVHWATGNCGIKEKNLSKLCQALRCLPEYLIIPDPIILESRNPGSTSHIKLRLSPKELADLSNHSTCDQCSIYNCRDCPVMIGYLRILGNIIDDTEKIKIKEFLNL